MRFKSEPVYLEVDLSQSGENYDSEENSEEEVEDYS